MTLPSANHRKRLERGISVWASAEAVRTVRRDSIEDMIKLGVGSAVLVATD